MSILVQTLPAKTPPPPLITFSQFYLFSSPCSFPPGCNQCIARTYRRTHCLVVTKGFRDLLHIGNQSRPNIFDLEIKAPEVLYETVVEVDELVVLPLGDEPNTYVYMRFFILYEMQYNI